MSEKNYSKYKCNKMTLPTPSVCSFTMLATQINTISRRADALAKASRGATRTRIRSKKKTRQYQYDNYKPAYVLVT